MRSLSILVMLALAGCDGPGTIPAPERAEAALRAALEAWKAGELCGEIAGQTPPVLVVDTQWQHGRVLEDYEILGPVPDSSPARINVKLTLDEPEAVQETSYVIVGTDPSYVYHDEDFSRLISMDNNPTPPASR